MARGKRTIGQNKRGTKSAAQTASDTAAANDTSPAIGFIGLPMPSPVAGTNIMIANIILRAAGGLLRDRMEKGLLINSHDKASAERLINGRSVTASMALWGASHLARRSPFGLAVVASGLAAKVFYDRGKRIEANRRVRKDAGTRSGIADPKG